jgi:hypothetical protein
VLTRFLGIIMLDTQFPRPVGDIGNLQSWPVEAKQVVVKGAFPDKIVATATGLRQEGLLGAFQATLLSLQAQGAAAVTTSCGFLVLLQADLQRAARIPVVTSSLLALPRLLRAAAADHKGAPGRVGVLTPRAGKLGAAHLRAAGVPREDLPRVVVHGVAPDSAFVRCILGNQTEMDWVQCRADLVAAALALQARAPDVRDVVLECTNMPPHREAIVAATGWRCWSLLDDPRLTDWARPAAHPQGCASAGPSSDSPAST